MQNPPATFRSNIGADPDVNVEMLAGKILHIHQPWDKVVDTVELARHPQRGHETIPKGVDADINSIVKE